MPTYGFPQAKRDDGAKVYMGELTKLNNAGKQSPGPIYNYTDENKYKKPPGWGFGSSDRGASSKPKYDFYENNVFLDDPLSADLSRKPKALAPKIGTEPRMQLNTLEHTPGPQYFPKEKPETKKEPNYTFGFRRQGAGNPLKNQTSTPGSVGPGRYVPEASAHGSNHADFPRWTLPKAGRTPTDRKAVDKNQTYDTRSAIGKQTHSKNVSSGVCHFGTSDRNTTGKLGTFKDMMSGGTKVKLEHPKF